MPSIKPPSTVDKVEVLATSPIVATLDKTVRYLPAINIHTIKGREIALYEDGVCGEMGSDTFERFETLLVQHLVRPGDICLDVGAHVGYYTLLLSELVGKDGLVLAYEPSLENFQMLSFNVRQAKCDNTLLQPIGLSDQHEELELSYGKNNSGDNRLWRDTNQMPGPQITLERADVIIPIWLTPDFIKIDTQGWESHVLRGLQKRLTKPSLKMLIEFWPYGLRGAGGTVKEFATLLQDFTLFLLDSNAHTMMRLGSPGNTLEDLDNKNNDHFYNLLALKEVPCGYPN